MPTRPQDRVSTRDPNAEKRRRVLAALQNPAVRGMPNRELGFLMGVDEATVRKYRRGLGLPPSEAGFQTKLVKRRVAAALARKKAPGWAVPGPKAKGKGTGKQAGAAKAKKR